MCLKVKTLFKVICFIAVIVLLSYIEGKYNLIFPNSSIKSDKATMAGRRVLAADFEVFGLVQGVFFRKNTEETAKKLGVRGWCMNTQAGTVKGQIETDNESAFSQMKEWLSVKGSPQSRIDKAEFSETKILPDFTFEDFGIRRVRR